MRTYGIPALIAFALAGCLSTPQEAPSDPRRLSDFENCNYKYPDNSSIGCMNHASPIALEPSRPESPWICLGRLGDGRVSYDWMWNPVSDQWGVYFDVGIPKQPTGGIVTVGPRGAYKAYEWASPLSKGFLAAPPQARDGDDFGIEVNHLSFSSNSTNLQAGRISGMWSIYRDLPWLVAKVQVDERSYYFHATHEIVKDRLYGPGSERIVGADFSIDIKYLHSGSAGFTIGNFGNPPC